QMIAFIDRLKITTERSLMVFILLFIAGSVIMLASTVHLAMSFRKTEMHIMKLMGASMSKMTSPYVLEGLILSCIAFLLHLAILGLLPIDMAASTAQKNALLAELAAVLVLGGGTSYLTTLFHLKNL
ncbi:hypothetical protein HYV58_00330, partial [Candidatus Peregrinibacteria bacterium]|nr:hypothetical protein [Candidatus Peregrinibacteria bacterium]